MDSTLLANDMRPGDITVSPILGTRGWYIYGEILHTPCGHSYSQLGIASTQAEAVETARELCRLDGVGLVWLFSPDGSCTQVPQCPDADGAPAS